MVNADEHSDRDGTPLFKRRYWKVVDGRWVPVDWPQCHSYDTISFSLPLSSLPRISQALRTSSRIDGTPA